jgi:uncharacterized protein YerC
MPVSQGDPLGTLAKAILTIGPDEGLLRGFLTDILTRSELRRISNRWNAILLVHQGTSYRKVSKQLVIGIETVSRAARVLQEGEGSAEAVLSRLRADDMFWANE